MKNIHIATFTMPIAYIIGKFRPTRLPTPLKLGKHRLTARFTNYILHQFNSASAVILLLCFYFFRVLPLNLRLPLGSSIHETPPLGRQVSSKSEFECGTFLHPTAMAMGQIVMLRKVFLPSHSVPILNSILLVSFIIIS